MITRCRTGFNGSFWPASLNGANPCVEDGSAFPIKPLSYFCPVTCGCRSGDKHCPDACPARSTTSVDYSGLDPHQSYNVYRYPDGVVAG